jgi:hypothetical protein
MYTRNVGWLGFEAPLTNSEAIVEDFTPIRIRRRNQTESRRNSTDVSVLTTETTSFSQASYTDQYEQCWSNK